MSDTRWWGYVQSLMGDQSQLEAAKKIGISKSNLTRWKDGARAAPDFVVKVARAYGANVLEALAAAEVITDEEASLRTVTVSPPLRSIDSNALIDELHTRLDAVRALLDQHENGANRGADIYRLGARPLRPDAADPWESGRVPDFSELSQLNYAADSSPDETQELYDRGETPID